MLTKNGSPPPHEISQAAVRVSQVRNRVVEILVFSLTLCAHVAHAQQAGQQTPPSAAQLGVPAEKVAPPQVPPGSRPPDHVFPAINSWSLGALVFSPDGKWLASGGYGDTVMVWNAATGAEESRLSRPQPRDNAVVKLAFSPDGTHLRNSATKEERRYGISKKRRLSPRRNSAAERDCLLFIVRTGKPGQRVGRCRKAQRFLSRSMTLAAEESCGPFRRNGTELQGSLSQKMESWRPPA